MPAGVPALTAEVVADEPVKAGALTEPLGVMVSAPPVVPTFAFAASVPITVMPSRSVASVHPAEQVPDVMSMRDPLGTPPPLVPMSTQEATGQSYRFPVAVSIAIMVKLQTPVGTPVNRRMRVFPACP